MKRNNMLIALAALAAGAWYWKSKQPRALPGMTADQATIPGSQQDQMIAAQNAGMAGLGQVKLPATSRARLPRASEAPAARAAIDFTETGDSGEPWYTRDYNE